MPKKPQKPITIQDLYPDLCPEEQEEAKANLLRYLNVVWRIYKRLESEGRLDEIKSSLLRHEWEKRSKSK